MARTGRKGSCPVSPPKCPQKGIQYLEQAGPPQGSHYEARPRSTRHSCTHFLFPTLWILCLLCSCTRKPPVQPAPSPVPLAKSDPQSFSLTPHTHSIIFCTLGI